MVNEKWKVWFWEPLASTVAAFGATPLVLWIFNKIGMKIDALTDAGIDKWIVAFLLIMLFKWLIVKKWK